MPTRRARRTLSPFVFLAPLAAPLLLASPAVHAAYTQVPVVRHTVEIDVAAPPAAVWSRLTQGRSLVTWCPVWKNPANAKISISKVGDVLDFTDAWGHGGRSVVTFLSPAKELRVAHEPNDGTYLCQAKLTLTAKGSGTHVRYMEQYTDESSPTDLAATAGKMEADMNATLAALKKAAESR